MRLQSAFLLACLCCLACGVGVRAADAAKTSKPNILFILADDLGWGDLGCYGNQRIKTPNLDKLARQGTMFTQFYVNASVCSPSRVAFSSGQYPARWAIHGHLSSHDKNARRGMPDQLDPAAPMISRQLQQVGYVTGHFGKWHLGGIPAARYGFDESKLFAGPPPNYPEQKTDPDFWAHSTDLFVDAAIDFVNRHHDQGKPFYVNLWTFLPHAPIRPTQEQLEPYNRFRSNSPPFTSPWRAYYAAVTSVDSAIGRLLDRLDELGIADNTLVLFSSDNGPEAMEISNARHSGVGSPGPLRGRKRSLYDGGVRMPFIGRWPGHVPAGRVERASVVAAVDFFPSLSAITGAPVPDGYAGDGEDVSDIWLGASRARKGPLMWEWRYRVFGHVVNRSPILSIRDGRWKLLMNPDHSRVELYDMAASARELDNVAGQHEDVVKQLSERVLKWQKTLPDSPFDTDAGQANYHGPAPEMPEAFD